MNTILASSGLILYKLFERYGIDVAALVRDAGVDPADLGDPGLRLPFAEADAVIEKTLAQVANPALGLEAARCWHPSNLGALGYAWLASSTLAKGLERLERYWRLLGSAEARLRKSADGTWFLHDPRQSRQATRAFLTDSALAVVLDMCRMNYGAALRPLEVRLRRGTPPDPAPYRKFFGCPVRFSAPENGFLLSRRVVDAPLPTANRQVAATFDRILAQQLARLDRGDIVALATATLLEQLPLGEASEEAVAGALEMSRRTLQRKLAERGLNYRELSDRTRRDLAMRYIEDPKQSIGDITFELGFAQQSAFTRAFRRWTGMTPSSYRQRLSPA
jgi:AraC-like DNA-binding protein